MARARFAVASLAMAGPALAMLPLSQVGGSLGAFELLFAMAAWLTSGLLLLAAAWFACEAGAPRDREGAARAFAAPLALMGLMAFLALPAFAGVLPRFGVDPYNLGHDVWLTLQAAALGLVALALLRPDALVRGPLRVAAVLGMGLTPLALAAAPWLPRFVEDGAATLAYDLALGGLGGCALLLALPLWRRWLRGAPTSVALLAAGVEMTGFALLAFLMQQTPAEVSYAWFGRMSMMSAGFLFLYATLSGPAPAPEAHPERAPSRG